MKTTGMAVRMFLLVLTVTLPVAQSITFEKAEFKHLTAGDVPVEDVAPNREVITTLEFSYLADNFEPTDILIDASNISIPDNGQQALSMKAISECTRGVVNRYTCEYTGLKLQIDESARTPYVNFTFSDGANQETIQRTFNFRIDSQPPVTTFVGPERCKNQDQCYVAPGDNIPVIAEFEPGTGSFEKNRLLAVVDPESSADAVFADTCEADTCYMDMEVTCSGDDTMTFQLDADESYDDAGNPVSGTYTNEVTCDAQPPSIDETNITSATNDGDVFLNQDARISVAYTENTDAAVTLKAETGDTNSTTQCAASPCSVTIPHQRDTPGEQTFEITLTDQAGNTDTADQTALVRASDTESALNVWSTEAVTNLVPRLNVNTITPRRTLTANIDFSAANTYRLTRATPRRCEFIGGSQQGRIQGIDVQHSTEDGKVILTYHMESPTRDSMQSLDELEVKCNLDLYTETDTTVYRTPEQQNVTINYPLSFANGIDINRESEINRTLNSRTAFEKRVSTVNNWIGKGKKLCNGLSIVAGGGAALGAASEALGLSGVGEWAKQLIDRGLSKLTGVQDAGYDIGAKFCEIATCTMPWQQRQLERFQNYASFGLEDSQLVEKVSFTGASYADSMSPQNNIAAAVFTACVPELLGHLEKQQQIKCGYAECLSRQVEDFGVSVAECQASKNYAQCTTLGRGIMKAVPIVGFLRDGLKRVLSILSDPVSLLTAAGNMLSCELIGAGNRGYGVCQAGKNAYATVQYYNTIRDMRTVFTPAVDKCAITEAALNNPDREWLYEEAARAAGRSPNPFERGNDDPGTPTTVGDFSVNAQAGTASITTEDGEENRFTLQRDGDTFTLLGDDGSKISFQDDGSELEVSSAWTVDENDPTKTLVGETSENPLIDLEDKFGLPPGQIGGILGDVRDAYDQGKEESQNKLNPEQKDAVSAFEQKQNDIDTAQKTVERAREKLQKAKTEVGLSEGSGELSTEAQAKIDEAQEAVDNAREELNNLKEDKTELAELQAAGLIDEAGDPTTAFVIQSGLGAAKFVRATRALGFNAWNDWGDLGPSFEFVDEMLTGAREITETEKLLCAASPFYEVPSGGAVYNDVLSTFQSGANPAALRTRPTVNEDGDTTRFYFVSYEVTAIKPSTDTADYDDLRFTVELRGPNGVLDITEELAETTPIQVEEEEEGEIQRYTASAPRTELELEGNYDKICLDFTPTPNNLGRYFDTVRNADKEICRNINDE